MKFKQKITRVELLTEEQTVIEFLRDNEEERKWRCRVSIETKLEVIADAIFEMFSEQLYPVDEVEFNLPTVALKVARKEVESATEILLCMARQLVVE